MLKKIITSFFLLTFCFISPFAHAQLNTNTIEQITGETTNTGVKSGLVASAEAAQKEDVKTRVLQIVQYALALLGTVMVIIILWAGAQIMLSGGNPDKIAAGKRTLINAIAGLAIILISYSGTIFLTKRLNKVFSEPQAGDPCKVDTDCPTGMRCAAQLLSKSVCAPWGVNALCVSCTTNADCPTNKPTCAVVEPLSNTNSQAQIRCCK